MTLNDVHATWGVVAAVVAHPLIAKVTLKSSINLFITHLADVGVDFLGDGSSLSNRFQLQLDLSPLTLRDKPASLHVNE